MELCDEWREFKADAARRVPCLKCGVVSPWAPKGWKFRYIGIRGGARRGTPKVTTERLCPTCWEKYFIGSESITDA